MTDSALVREYREALDGVAGLKVEKSKTFVENVDSYVDAVTRLDAAVRALIAEGAEQGAYDVSTVINSDGWAIANYLLPNGSPTPQNEGEQ